MAQVIYNDGSLYNGGGLYGRIDAALAAAAAASVRETGLKVQVIDSRLNNWELWAGTQQFPGGPNLGAKKWGSAAGAGTPAEIGYWGYRGTSHIAKLSGGNIIRVRIGDPTSSTDRQVWIQTITDPTVQSQWTSWSVLYSGTHYGTPAVQPTGASTYDIYHCKSDGLYKNNALVWSNSGGRTALQWMPVAGSTTAGWVLVMRQYFSTGNAVYDLYWSPNPSTTTPVVDNLNFSWARINHASILMDDGVTVARVIASPLHFNPRDANRGMELWMIKQPIATPQDLTLMSAPYVVRGLSGGPGSNYYLIKSLQKLSDGYYYLFAHEVHQGTEDAAFSNLGIGIPTWMRSRDLRYWSEPVVGPPLMNGWGVGGVVESGGYVYFTDTELVYRRPATPLTYDVSNYVPEVQFELPRDNQAGSGKLVLANPANVHNAIRQLSDAEITVEPGIRVATGQFLFQGFNRFFIDQFTREIKGAVDRLTVSFSDIWERLNVPFRDVTNFIGRMNYQDFDASGTRNKTFNYFFRTDTSPTVKHDAYGYYMQTQGRVLYTGWKGINPDVEVYFASSTGNPEVVVRYLDENNFLTAVRDTDNGLIVLKKRSNGKVTTVASTTTTTNPVVKIRFRLIFNNYDIWVNGVLKLTGQVTDWGGKQIYPGYVGWAATTENVRRFRLYDYEEELTAEDLIRTALAMGDFHDVTVGGADNRVMALTWGPQTDNNSPAAALRQILETEKLQLIWRNGRVEIGQFNDQTVIKTINNELIEADDIDSARDRINLAAVDGNEHWWLEIDLDDALKRDRMIVGYYDLPELLDQQSVTNRAREEIKRSTQGSSPGGTTPLFLDLWRMDAVNWTLPDGTVETVRIEGFNVEINQGVKPFQRQTFDLSRYSTGSSDGAMKGGSGAGAGPFDEDGKNDA